MKLALLCVAVFAVYAISRLDLDDDDEIYARLIRGGAWR